MKIRHHPFLPNSESVRLPGGGTAHGGSAATMPPPQPHVSAYLKISIAQLILTLLVFFPILQGGGSGGGGRERGGSIELVQTVSQVDQLRQRAVAAERSGAMIDLTESDGEEEGEIRERDR